MKWDPYRYNIKGVHQHLIFMSYSSVNAWLQFLSSLDPTYLYIWIQFVHRVPDLLLSQLVVHFRFRSLVDAHRRHVDGRVDFATDAGTRFQGGGAAGARVTCVWKGKLGQCSMSWDWTRFDCKGVKSNLNQHGKDQVRRILKGFRISKQVHWNFWTKELR